jgi:hypothetical protein
VGTRVRAAIRGRGRLPRSTMQSQAQYGYHVHSYDAASGGKLQPFPDATISVSRSSSQCCSDIFKLTEQSCDSDFFSAYKAEAYEQEVSNGGWVATLLMADGYQHPRRSPPAPCSGLRAVRTTLLARMVPAKERARGAEPSPPSRPRRMP